MPLFTFVAEYKGGTYVSQIRATNVKAAQKVWVRSLEPKSITGLGETSHQRLVDRCASTAPIALEGLRNAWFFDVNGFFVNIITTQQN
jgi:hypothetical protein